MKFTFRTLVDFNERPAHIMAHKVAAILRERGHTVEVKQFPKSAQLIEIGQKKRTLAEIEETLRKRADNFPLGEFLESSDSDVHVIDFHNSPPISFFPTSKKSIHEYSISIHAEEEHAFCGNPISLTLHGKTRKGRIVASLELPAIQRRFRATPFTKNIQHAVREIENAHAGKKGDPSLIDLKLDFLRKRDHYSSVSETKKYGWLSDEFAEKIATALEKTASTYPKVKLEPEKLEEERELAGLIRELPDLLTTNARDIDVKIRELTKRRTELITQGRLTPSAEINKEIIKINDAVKNLNDRQQILTKVRDMYPHVDPMNTLRRLRRKFGLTAHFSQQ